MSATAAAYDTASAGDGRGTMLPGPVEADVRRVIDGDTLLVRAHIWLGQRIDIRVRVRGIDAPELRSRCAAERLAAQRATEEVSRRVQGRRVHLTRIARGKYAGRVLADVELPGAGSLSATLLALKLVTPYRPHSKRHGAARDRNACPPRVTSRKTLYQPPELAPHQLRQQPPRQKPVQRQRRTARR
ncbi:MAG: hypothetical protein AAFQ42_03985 [Pseudomonadota bacterium]